MRAKEFIIESYQPPSLSTGDTVLIGKFKNRKAEIKGFKKDKHNQPVLKTNKGEVQLFKPRISKLMPEGVAEGSENLSYIGNCTDDDVIEHIFGDATGFAQAVDEYGDEFTLDDLVVKYDPETDVHSFYYKEQGVAEGYSNTTFNVDRRKLNVPALIQKGAILVTHPHGEQGWETDNKEDWAFSLISLYNVLQGGWPSEAKKYLKPQSYKRAEQQINSSAPNLGSDKLVYDGKYNQILWSIKKLGIPDNVAFLDKDKQGVAEEVNPDVTSDEYFIEPTENVRMGDFVFNARTFSGGLGDPNARGLQIRAYDPKNLKGSIGSADFIVKKDKKGNTWLESDDTEVDELYRGKGVAAMMYAFAKSLGNDIKDSPYKSKAGSDMWKKWGSDAKHLVGQPGVPEDLTETTSQLGPQLYTPHPKNLDESMKPENVLWTSTASGNNNGYTSAWVRWAKNEMPGWIGHSGFLYDVSPSARILTINSDRDAMRVAKEYGLRTTDIMDLFRYMPWNKIAKDYDAIHHVPSNRGSDIFMYAWDVESTAWFNTKMLLNKRKVPIVASKQGMAE